MNQKIAANAISYAVEEVTKKNKNEIIKVVTNNKGNVAYVSTNPTIISKITAEVQQLVQSYLNGAEEGDMQNIKNPKYHKNTGELVYSVPIGRVTGNVLLGNLGPDIPIKFHVLGDADVDTEFKLEQKGINSTYITSFIKVKVHVQTIIPFASKITKYDQKIPGPSGAYNGDIPLYNSNGESSPPSIQLNDEENKEKTKKK